MGKPLSQARNEINATKGRVQFFLDNLDKALADDLVTQKDKVPHWSKSSHYLTPLQLQEVTKFEPLGVIANISAWNYPYFVGSNVYIPALLTGNSVLYKPSEFALVKKESDLPTHACFFSKHYHTLHSAQDTLFLSCYMKLEYLKTSSKQFMATAQ